MRWATPSPACTPTAILTRPARRCSRWRRALGVSVEDAARQILERATDKILPTVEQLIAEYGLDRDQLLVGEGGGAGALLPFVAERLGLRARDLARCRGDLLDRRGARAWCARWSSG